MTGAAKALPIWQRVQAGSFSKSEIGTLIFSDDLAGEREDDQNELCRGEHLADGTDFGITTATSSTPLANVVKSGSEFDGIFASDVDFHGNDSLRTYKSIEITDENAPRSNGLGHPIDFERERSLATWEDCDASPFSAAAREAGNNVVQDDAPEDRSFERHNGTASIERSNCVVSWVAGEGHEAFQGSTASESILLPAPFETNLVPALIPPANAMSPPPPTMPRQPGGFPRSPYDSPPYGPGPGPRPPGYPDPNDRNRSLSDEQKQYYNFADDLGNGLMVVGGVAAVAGWAAMFLIGGPLIIPGAVLATIGAIGFIGGAGINYLSNHWRNYLNQFDPLVIDLDGDGVEVSLAPVALDLDGDGFVEVNRWIAASDGILVRDEGGDGIINHISELTFSSVLNAGQTDLDRLAVFDSNNDGEFDAADSGFSQFKIWRDFNQNGQSDAGELFALSELGITSISLAGSPINLSVGNVAYWSDLDGDGIIDANEIFTSAADAPANSVAVKNISGGWMLDSTKVTTATGTLAAYSIALDFNPNGVKIELQGNDLVVTYKDGHADRYYLAQTSTGETIDLTQTAYAGAFGSAGDDNFSTSGDHDVWLFGMAGNDILVGGAGDDVIAGGAGSDTLNGAAGDDILYIDAVDLTTNIHGGSGTDTIFVEGEIGISLDLVATGTEAAFGNAGNDAFTAAGAASGVILQGGAGNDSLTGGDGGDLLKGDAGADSLLGGGGDDSLWIDAHDAVVSGGDGRDAVYVTSSDSVTLNLTAASIELAFGNDGQDVFVATGSDRVLLSGGGGNDVLTGGSADDRLIGDAGDDMLSGNAGLDVAVFSGKATDYSIVASANGYTVTDTNVNDGDDGTDELHGIERLVFADQTIHLDQTNSTPNAYGEIWRLRDNGGALQLSAALLTENDWDVDSDRLQVAAISTTAGGDVSITSTGDILLNASSPSGGLAQVSYLVVDGHGGQSWATSELEISAALPTDSLMQYQWALDALNVFDAWDDYTGEGIDVALNDSGVDKLHSDIAPNYVDGPDDELLLAPHGTFVTGLAGASRDGSGIVGVAYDANITMSIYPYVVFDTYDSFSDYDVVSNSWVSTISHVYGIKNDADFGRGGFGTNTVFSGGNGRASGDDGNLYPDLSSRYVITVGAIDTTGKVASYSSPSSSLLVVAPGSQIISADITGSTGYADESGAFGANYFLASGTSASAPLVAGVVALMLDANPGLGWRDVQEILAYSAWNPDPANTGWTTNGALNWNGGGLHVSRDYGFGLVDSRAAVRLAETWQTTSTSANEVSTNASTVVNQAIPDNTGGSVTSSVTVTDDIEIDHVEVTFDIAHTNVGDLVVELISPDGTKSVLVNRLGVDPGSTTDCGSTADSLTQTFSSTHYWGGLSGGQWTLVVRDLATGEVGQINSWSLKIYGDTASENDTYVYTVDFGTMISGVDAERRVLSDGGGHDAINASPIFQDAVLDLRAGQTSQLAGNHLLIAAGTTIEDAYLGDGDDHVIGNAVDNHLWGGRGNDVVEGGGGADTVDGAQGSDTASYAGSAAAVSINLSAATAVGGDAQGDVLVNIENLEGSAFSDTLTGNALNNVLTGGLGDDVLTGAAGNDLLQGEAGADQLVGGDGDDKLSGGAGDDQLDGGLGADTAYFSRLREDYTITMVGGLTTVIGADGSDQLAGIEFLKFQDQSVYIGGPNAAPTAQSFSRTVTQRGPFTLAETEFLQGAVDPDADALSLYAVFASSNGLVTLTSSGDVRFEVDPAFVGTTSFDFVVSDGKLGEAHATVSVTVAPTYTFNGTIAADTFEGLGSADTLYGNEGDDRLDGGFGNDNIFGGVGNDTLIGGAGTNLLDGGDGVDAVSYETAKAGVVVDLAAGTGTISGSTADTYVNIEKAIGSSFGDLLKGTTGNDILNGRAGTDSLQGGAGEDTYIFNRGDGHDTILDVGTGIDTLELGPNILTAEVSVRGSGRDLVITFARSPGDSITLTNATHDSSSRIEQLRFANGTIWTYGQMFALATTSTAGNDSLYGDEQANTLSGGDGDDLIDGWASSDVLNGNGGNDILAGGTGDDTLNGGVGNDTYVFNLGDGSDTIFEGDGNDILRLGPGLTAANVTLNVSGYDLLINDGASGDQIRLTWHYLGSANQVETLVYGDGTTISLTGGLPIGGGAGNDVLNGTAFGDTIRGNAGDDSLSGNNGDDTLTGGTGTDTLNGGAGNDTYVFNLGDGSDTIFEGDGNDILRLGPGLTAANVTFIVAGYDLLIQDGVSGDQIRLNWHYLGSANQVETLVYGDGTTISLTGGLPIVGGAGNDVLNGTAFGDTLEGNAGNDTLNAGEGDDSLSGGTGDDGLNAAGGNDVLNGGADNDTLYAGEGNDTVNGGDGTDALNGEAGNDILDGGANNDTLNGGGGDDVSYGGSGDDYLNDTTGDDTFVGGSGNDTIRSGAGNDIYIYSSGDGNDLINEDSGSIVDVDILRFTDLNSSDLSLTRAGYHLDIAIVPTGQKIHVEWQVWSTAEYWGLEKFEFQDGTSWNRDQIMQNIWWNGAAGDDTMSGWNSFDQINGGAGNDTINGNAGVDTLVGGAGNDTLTGGAGNDKFVFQTGFGQDTINDFTAGAGSDDVIEFQNGIFANFAAVQSASQQVGSDVLITVDASNTILLKNVAIGNLHANDFLFV